MDPFRTRYCGKRGSAKRKRPRKGIYDASHTDEQRAIIAQAASAFHLSAASISAAISHLQNSSPSAPREERRITKQPPKRKMRRPSPKSDVSDKSTLAPSNFRENQLFEESRMDSNLRSDSRLPIIDNCFGFDIAASQWADCFASLPMGQEYGAADVGGYFSTSGTNTNTSFAFKESLTQPQLAMPPIPHNSPTLDMNEADSCYTYFACDEHFPLPQWLSPSFSSQNTQVEMTQPSAYGPMMVYSNANSSLSQSPWDPGRAFVNMEKEDYYQTQIWSSEEEGILMSESSSSDGLHTSDSTDSSERTNPSRRGPFKSTVDREQTAQTRQLTACLRCRMQRIRCIPDPSNPRGVCITCKKVSVMKVSKLPCLRYKITDVVLFKSGFVPGHVWSKRWLVDNSKDIDAWASPELRTIQITQDYSPTPLTVMVRRFIPEEGDMLHRSWVDGTVKKSVMLPPYAFASLKATKQVYMDYINQEGTLFFKHGLDFNDKLLWETYSTAIKASNHAMTELERKLLKMVLRMWVSTRMTTRASRICGKDTLGLPSDLMDQSSPMHGKIPITPVMGAQIDLILLQAIQLPLRGLILEQLQRLVLANKPSNWFCIYLSVFILLHNCSLLTANDAWYARKHGLKTRFARRETVADLHMGANILLAYFHYCTKGFRPFDLDWNAAESTSMAELNAEQVQFIQKTANYVKFNEARFHMLREQECFEHEHYFVAQLYERDWKPRSTV